MHAVATKLLLQPGEYETETREWSKLSDDQQTWTAWKKNFREAYVEKRRAEAAWKVEDKPFGGFTVNDAQGQIRQQGHTASSRPPPVTNKMLASLEGYFNNIAAAAKHTVTKRGPLAELEASITISINTMERQQQEIKRLYMNR